MDKMLKMDVDSVRRQAVKELKDERFHEAVEKEKDKLRKKRKLWDVIFPYSVVFVKKKK